jgi:hypothetical protein
MCLLVSTLGGAWSNRYREIDRKLAPSDLRKLSRMGAYHKLFRQLSEYLFFLPQKSQYFVQQILKNLCCLSINLPRISSAYIKSSSLQSLPSQSCIIMTGSCLRFTRRLCNVNKVLSHIKSKYKLCSVLT